MLRESRVGDRPYPRMIDAWAEMASKSRAIRLVGTARLHKGEGMYVPNPAVMQIISTADFCILVENEQITREAEPTPPQSRSTPSRFIQAPGS